MSTKNPYGLAVELARPVAAGLLDHGSAIAALIAAAVQRERVTPYRAPETFRGLKHLYRQQLQRELMRHAIERMRQRWEARNGG